MCVLEIITGSTTGLLFLLLFYFTGAMNIKLMNFDPLNDDLIYLIDKLSVGENFEEFFFIYTRNLKFYPTTSLQKS